MKTSHIFNPLLVTLLSTLASAAFAQDAVNSPYASVPEISATQDQVVPGNNFADPVNQTVNDHWSSPGQVDFPAEGQVDFPSGGQVDFEPQFSDENVDWGNSSQLGGVNPSMPAQVINSGATTYEEDAAAQQQQLDMQAAAQQQQADMQATYQQILDTQAAQQEQLDLQETQQEELDQRAVTQQQQIEAQAAVEQQRYNAQAAADQKRYEDQISQLQDLQSQGTESQPVQNQAPAAAQTTVGR